MTGERNCNLCDREFDSVSRARSCSTCIMRVRRHAVKQAIVERLGARCAKCDWTGPIAGFDVHHLDPAEKEFNISNNYCRSPTDIAIELTKCKLLCAVCHRLIHAQPIPDFLQERIRALSASFWDEKPKVRTHCTDCNKTITRGSWRCGNCAGKRREAVRWPTDGELLLEVEETNMNRVAKRLGVTFNAVKKRVSKIEGP